MRLYEEQFLWLLRAGLWGKEESPFPMIAPCYIDWSSLLSLAKRQTTLLLVQDGLELLLEGQKARGEERVAVPPRALLKVQNMRMQTQKVHNDLNQLILELDGLLRSVGILPLLLKGESMASLYLCPESRNCGDIDLFVFPEDYTRAARLLATCLEQIEMATEKHGTFRRGRYNVELHFCPLVLQRPWLRHYFDLYTREKLSDVHETVSLPFAEGKVLVPPVTYNAIFLLAHIYHHFIEGGIGLRQICDWTLFLDRNFERLDVDELATKLEQFGLMNAWKVFVSLAVGFLGLKRDRAPFYDADEHYARKAKEILTIILKEGNFGRYGKGELAKKKDDSYSTKKSKSFKLGLQRLKCRIPIFPLDTLLFFPKWASESLFRLFKKR